MSKFTNKVVWITGASSGIGEALAYELDQHHAILLLSGRNVAELERVKSKCKHHAAVVAFDISETDNIPRIVATVLEQFTTVDFLVNCAGVSQRSYAKLTGLRVYEQLMQTNYLGTVALSLELLKHFLAKNAGEFITVTSVAGIVGLPKRTAYCASKYALEGFFASLRTEVWRTGIKILIVRPGAVHTNIARNALTAFGKAAGISDNTIEHGMEPKECAHAIINASIKNKQVVVVGSLRERLLFLLHRFFPGLIFNRVKRLEDERNSGSD